MLALPNCAAPLGSSSPNRTPAAASRSAPSGYADVVDPLSEDLAAAVEAATNGGGADVVIEAAGRPETAAQAVELACHGGRILFFGVAAPGKQASIEPNRVFARELTIVGSIRNPFHAPPRHGNHAAPASQAHRHASLCARDIADAFAAAHRGDGLKICIKAERLTARPHPEPNGIDRP